MPPVLHNLIDTHAHYDDPAFAADRDAVLRALPEAGIARAISVSASMENSRGLAELVAPYPYLYYTVGVHPSELDGLSEAEMDELVALAKGEKCVAIGEIGLDYHYEPETAELQKRWFRRQMELARALDLPVVIHEREACGDCMEILRDFRDVRCVVHCFSGSPETAAELLRMGHSISFTGVLTFKNARRAPDVLRMLPPDRLMLETDSPYMAPEPCRGTRNDSRLLPYIALRAAEILGEEPQALADRTTENAKRFFGMK